MKKDMKKLKLTVVSAVIAISGALLGMQQAAGTSIAHHISIISGMNCEAANLNQALQGMSWSQAGIVNNASIPLFVVCPLDPIIGGGQTATGPAVGAIFPGSGTIACTARSQDFNSGSYASYAFNIVPGGNPNYGSIVVPLARVSAVSNNTVVCALDPGEGIEYTFYF